MRIFGVPFLGKLVLFTDSICCDKTRLIAGAME